MRISIVGTGYVGLVSGACLADIGHDVICVDIDESKIERINRGEAPIYEEGLADMLSRVVGTRLQATTNLKSAVLDTDLTIIAVGTPFDGERISLRFIERATREIGEALASKDAYHVVVVKSTVVPGTTETTVLPILESASGKTAGPAFGVGMNPEFLREGAAVADFMEPDRIVLGGIDDATRAVMAEVYKPFAAAEKIFTTPRTAEMIKYTANSLLASLISFSNEIANLSAEVGVDAKEVMRGVQLDKRFTPLLEDGTRIWPGAMAYLEGGCGFGGSCFPKDVKALIAFGREHSHEMAMLESVIAINEQQPHRMLELLTRHYPSLEGISVSVLGMAFKPATDDIRESPALIVVDELLDRGALVSAFDPIAGHEVQQRYGSRVAYPADLDQAVLGASALVIMTGWDEFLAVPAIIEKLGVDPVVIDGRRILDPLSVSRYEGIGR
jgi:UDPglucose 6-dehydrogenase